MAPTDPTLPKTVLMTTDTMGGVWTYSLDLVRGLTEHGVRVYLATMGDPLSPAQAAEAARVPDLQVLETTYKLEWMEQAWDDITAAGSWLLWMEEQLRPDLIHLNGYVHAAWPWKRPVLVVGHSCVYSWFHATTGGDPPQEWGWETYRQAVTNGLRAADLVVTPTHAMRQDLQRHYGDFGATRVIYNGRDLSAWEVDEKEPFVLTVGRIWDAAKNVRALEEIADQLPWPVYAAGWCESPKGETTETPHLHTLGRLAPQDLARWFERAAVYALPARYEPFGLSILEAALAGCALVLGDIPSLREVWGDAALFVDPDDRAALVHLLHTLTEDGERRGELALRARSRAARYTRQRMVDGYLDAYRELMVETRLRKAA